jgi:hypothetical protein
MEAMNFPETSVAVTCRYSVTSQKKAFLFHRLCKGRACSTNGGGESVCRVLVRKPEGKRPLGRPRLRWEDNIQMELQEVGIGSSWLRIGTGGGHL